MVRCDFIITDQVLEGLPLLKIWLGNHALMHVLLLIMFAGHRIDSSRKSNLPFFLHVSHLPYYRIRK